MALLTISTPGIFDLHEAPWMGGEFSGEKDNRINLSFWTISPGDSLRIMTHGGDDYVDAAGFAPPVTLYLGSGNDTLYLGDFGLSGYEQPAYFDQAGRDLVYAFANSVVYAGFGNDTYFGEVFGRQTISFQFITDLQENSTMVMEGIRFDLSKTGRQDLGLFGKDVTRNFDGVVGTEGDDRIWGNELYNILDGASGNDTIVARAERDSLIGGNGADILIGGSGADTFDLNEDGAARDVVRYLSMTDSSARLKAGVGDTVQGFVLGEDKIDLSAIDANLAKKGNQAFVFRSEGDFRSKAGEVLIEVSGSDSLVLIDIDGDVAPEMVIRLEGVTGLTAGDFIL